jgi:DNA polymerase-3 subunit epsilon
MILFFDTETTGVPRNYKAPLSDLANWPRMVQLAWLLTDETGTEIESAEYIIKPDGFVIPREASRVHGITTDQALEHGFPLSDVLDKAEPLFQRAAVLVAHNISFDEKILGAELLRAGRATRLETKERRCTMRLGTDFCRLPGPYGYKWPTLQELHKKLFDASFDGAHRALADVRACARCYFELQKERILGHR